jgi:hypothetical protein
VIILWDQGTVAPPHAYYGLGFVWTWAGTLGDDVVATPNICIDLTAVSRLDVTLAAVSQITIDLTATPRLDVTLTAPECD